MGMVPKTPGRLLNGWLPQQTEPTTREVLCPGYPTCLRPFRVSLPFRVGSRSYLITYPVYLARAFLVGLVFNVAGM